MAGIKQNSWIPILGIVLIGAYILFSQIRSLTIKPKTESRKAEKQISLKPNKNQELPTLLEPGLFQIQMPEQFAYPPYKVLQEIPDPESGQSLTMPYYRYQSSDGLNTYEIGYMRLPEERFQSKSHEQILNDLMQGELSRIQGLLRKEITINQSSQSSSREIHIESITNNLYAREMLIINRPYIYIICFSSKNKSALLSPKADQYFASFSLFKQNNIMPKTIILDSDTSNL